MWVGNVVGFKQRNVKRLSVPQGAFRSRKMMVELSLQLWRGWRGCTWNGARKNGRVPVL